MKATQMPLTRVIERRAPTGGQELFNHKYLGGEYLPFYVPRERMPQIDEDDIPALLAFAHHHKVEVSHSYIAPKVLRAHQHVSINRVKSMPDGLLAKPCLISDDSYVLDGNHRWWGHMMKGTAVPSLVFALPFDKAIPWLFTFPKAYSYGDGNLHSIHN